MGNLTSPHFSPPITLDSIHNYNHIQFAITSLILVRCSHPTATINIKKTLPHRSIVLHSLPVASFQPPTNHQPHRLESINEPIKCRPSITTTLTNTLPPQMHNPHHRHITAVVAVELLACRKMLTSNSGVPERTSMMTWNSVPISSPRVIWFPSIPPRRIDPRCQVGPQNPAPNPTK